MDRPPFLTHPSLEENGEQTCTPYWPVTGSQHFGSVSVTTLMEEVTPFYTVRTLSIHAAGDRVVRGITCIALHLPLIAANSAATLC